MTVSFLLVSVCLGDERVGLRAFLWLNFKAVLVCLFSSPHNIACLCLVWRCVLQCGVSERHLGVACCFEWHFGFVMDWVCLEFFVVVVVCFLLFGVVWFDVYRVLM